MAFAVIVIPERLKRARTLLRLSQRELAAKVGLSVATLSALENHAVDVRMSTVQQLCDALGVSPNYLTGYELQHVPLNGYLPITHDPVNCANCQTPCDRVLVCPDCGESLTAGEPHPAGECIVLAWQKGTRSFEYLSLRHGIPVEMVSALISSRSTREIPYILPSRLKPV